MITANISIVNSGAISMLSRGFQSHAELLESTLTGVRIVKI